ncbi:MAG: glycosyltransferase [Chloroflexi bacterium]|jgi:chlorobactene glucosyltransferase|nr:glycosyltransferase [Chloroflexota bacterium]
MPMLFSSLACLIALILIYWLHSRVAIEVAISPAPLPPDAPAPLISIIVPARNEARNIRRCAETLLAQSYPNFELIVVDDRSTDATPQILAELAAQAARLRVLTGREKPPEWAGKPHALVQGVEIARGEWLCFVDADTFAHQHLISSACLAAGEQQADLFTLLTDQELGTFWEKAVLPLVFTGLAFGFPARQVNDPAKPEAIANGQFFLICRAAYEDVGGHRAVHNRIDEDKAFAEVVKGAGYRLFIADGRAVARTRMYTSLPEMWEGWTKNIFLGLRDRLGLLAFGAFAALMGALALPAWLLAGLLWFAAAGGLPAFVVTLEALLVWGFLLYWRARSAQAFQISGWYAFTLPLGAAIFAAMMFASAYKVLFGRGVTWKGRQYQGR